MRLVSRKLEMKDFIVMFSLGFAMYTVGFVSAVAFVIDSQRTTHAKVVYGGTSSKMSVVQYQGELYKLVRLEMSDG